MTVLHVTEGLQLPSCSITGILLPKGSLELGSSFQTLLLGTPGVSQKGAGVGVQGGSSAFKHQTPGKNPGIWADRLGYEFILPFQPWLVYL